MMMMRKTLCIVVALISGASLLQVASPFRLQLGLPGLSAEVGVHLNVARAGTGGQDDEEVAARLAADQNGDTSPFGSPAAGDTSFAIGLGSSPADGIEFNLFTRSNPSSPQRLLARDATSVRRSSFRADRPTKILIHGFTANNKPGSGGDFLKDVLLRAADVNVILVDWSGVDPRLYPVDVQSTVPAVGAEVAGLVKTLIDLGVRADEVHLIGHSLGAHIAGEAGRLSLGPARAGRITGLDPAGPLFEGSAEASRLDPSDAGFVDAVHTDGGLLGIVQPVADVDFYVDGGMHRHPGCGADLYGACSHCFAYEVFAHAIEHPAAITGTKCDSHDSFQRGECTANEKTPVGLHTNSRSRGSFFVDSNLKPSENLRSAGSLLVSTALGQLSRTIIGDGYTTDRFVRC